MKEMKVIIVDIPKELKDYELSHVTSESIYNHFVYHGYRVYEIILDDPITDDAKIAVVDEYQPEYMIVTLMPDRTIEELPVDMQSKIEQIIKIKAKE